MKKTLLILSTCAALYASNALYAMTCPPMKDVQWVAHAIKHGYFSSYFNGNDTFPEYSIPANAAAFGNPAAKLAYNTLPTSINNWLKQFAPPLEPQLVIDEHANGSGQDVARPNYPLWLPSGKPVSLTAPSGAQVCLYSDSGYPGSSRETYLISNYPQSSKDYRNYMIKRTEHK